MLYELLMKGRRKPDDKPRTRPKRRANADPRGKWGEVQKERERGSEWIES